MATVVAVPIGTYTIDPTHSNVGFAVRHMGIATVRGTFRTFEGTIEAGDDSLTLHGAVQVASIDTGDENRDGHLQSPEFFDAAQSPLITFTSSAAEIGGEDITLSGEITIKGVSKPITLTGTFAEGGEDPWGNQRIGFEVETAIDRRDFGLTWNQTLPNGNALVANLVKLTVSVSAVKAA